MKNTFDNTRVSWKKFETTNGFSNKDIAYTKHPKTSLKLLRCHNLVFNLKYFTEYPFPYVGHTRVSWNPSVRFENPIVFQTRISLTQNIPKRHRNFFDVAIELSNRRYFTIYLLFDIF